MSLQDRLDAFKADFEAGKPPYKVPHEIIVAMHRTTNELIESGLAKRAKGVGDLAPEFMLEDTDGNWVSSTSMLARGPLVVTFYRGVWCPYCNIELQALQETLLDIQGLGANLLAISPKRPRIAPNRSAKTASASRSSVMWMERLGRHSAFDFRCRTF
jgi:thiol-disulfide isomerase/thioredoxin